MLRNSLQANGLESSHFTLAVTSSRSGEGKTTTTANLGVTLANAGRKVILVDANFRNPELGHLFGIDGVWGSATSCSEIAHSRRSSEQPSIRTCK